MHDSINFKSKVSATSVSVVGPKGYHSTRVRKDAHRTLYVASLSNFSKHNAFFPKLSIIFVAFYLFTDII